MGFLRVFLSGILGILLMIPVAAAVFYGFNTITLITGGLIQNFSGLLASLGPIWMFLLSAFIGVGIACLVPVHWVLIYHPDNVLLLLALTLPWIITCSLTSFLTAHSPRGGLHTSIAIGIGYFILMLIPYLALSIFLGSVGGAAIIDGILMGITGMPWVLSALTATMEGAGIGGVFAALVGSLKYKAEGTTKKSKKSWIPSFTSQKSKDTSEPTIGGGTTSSTSTASSADRCTNCGAMIVPGDDFCTNCGTKRK